jgi:glutamate/tyrosine decarboxylase-like PLP-dependent enzyme
MTKAAWLQAVADATHRIADWEARWPPFDSSASLDAAALDALSELTERLEDNYPFFHPLYAGQMLKPPHPVASAAYATAMWINPNNHALDGGPATAALEREVVAALGQMLGLDAPLGHLSASGTVANLEALWIARCCRPNTAFAVSDAAHYTHARMASVLGVRVVGIATDGAGRMSVDALRDALDSEAVGTVIATAGTTGLGAIDPIDAIATVCRERDVRLHVDAAYGGFFALLAQRTPPLVAPAPFAAIQYADSVVIDPHKHGLQPYGCGCVLFRDPSVGQFYVHDSPYTYFTSDALHLGEITLECSRAGASAAALWTTVRALTLSPTGALAEGLASGRRAALAWADAIAAEPRLRLVDAPDTDILAFAPWSHAGEMTASQVSAATDAVFEAGMAAGADGFYLAKLRLERGALEDRWPDLVWDTEQVTVLRSVLMKPEHEAWWPTLHERVCAMLGR